MLYRDYGKRSLDVVGSACALVIAAPLLFVGAVAIRATMGAPVLFRQERTGRDRTHFGVLKLRTMVGADATTVADRDRLTPVGRWLRRWSIDELPQLWNVLIGEMSLIGPRPLLPQYEPFYTEHERKRFEVRPGITGWAQVNGRNDSPWDDRLANDVWYVENVSLALDLKIAVLTLRRWMSGAGLHVDSRSALPDLDQVRASRDGFG